MGTWDPGWDDDNDDDSDKDTTPVEDDWEHGTREGMTTMTMNMIRTQPWWNRDRLDRSELVNKGRHLTVDC